MDVRQDAAAGDGDGAQELVELFVVADGEVRSPVFVPRLCFRNLVRNLVPFVS